MLAGSFRAPIICMGWLTAVLAADAGASLAAQRWLGVATWGLLLVMLWSAASLLRLQTAIVVVFATVVEYVFSDWLGVYVYRLDNVPAFVPPGHGLVYLAAFALGHQPWVRARLVPVGWSLLTLLGLWAAWGVFVAERIDALGAFWFVCLLGFWVWGPSREVYLGAVVVVTWLELVGTGFGTWSWQAIGPGGVPMGNPPSGAAGGYGWFDLAALLMAPWMLSQLSRRRASGGLGGVRSEEADRDVAVDSGVGER